MRNLLLLGVALCPALFADTISFSGSEQQYDIVTSGTYYIVAYGAQGATNGPTAPGGTGAILGGDFVLTAGEILDLYIGGQGRVAGGGGATWVALAGTPGALLLVAGGGGGGYAYAGGNATAGNSGSGGGSAGATGSGYGGAGGGGGYASAGGSGSAPGGGCGGQGFPTLTGGCGSGGYGGGGGGGFAAGGGGGGYSGGNGADANSLDGGGGGGSYFSTTLGANESALTGVNGNTGNGYVTIVPATPSLPTPEPGCGALTAVGVVGLLAVVNRRRSGTDPLPVG